MAKQTQNSKEEKIAIVSAGLAKSAAFKRNIDLPVGKWAGILADLDEEQIDDFLLILNEEQEMLMGNKKTESRKIAISKARYLQRLEQLKMTSERADDNLNE